MAAVAHSDRVRHAKPNLEKIKTLTERGLLLTAPDQSGEYDFIYRAFFPKLDVPEDPVTGSAITSLGPYWAHRLGNNKLRAYQASARGGILEIEVTSDRVLISGTAVTVFEGVFKSPPL
jgi:PhzF family phenazine biosynthesis protein